MSWITMTRGGLAGVKTPPHTETFFPVPHHQLLTMVEEKLGQLGFEIQDREIEVSRDGLRMACKLRLGSQNDELQAGYRPMVAIFNGNDKQHSIRVGLGLEVRVCQNGMVSADRVVARKHTKNCIRDLPAQLDSLFDEEREWHLKLQEFLVALRRVRPTKLQVNDLLVTAMERDVIPSSHIKKVADLYRDPTYEEYGTGTLYTLHSAFTEVIRDAGTHVMPRKTSALNELMVPLVQPGSPQGSELTH